MTLLTIAASVFTGIIVGGWLTLIVAYAAMSRSQEHMQKKVRYWQEQARLARLSEHWAEYEQTAPADYRSGALTTASGWPHHGYDASEP
jgi:hypothetical protein